MKKTLEEKLQMCKEHVEEGKSLSHICEYYNIDEEKYAVNLYKRYDRKGNCLDNSPTENFFERLKEEIWHNKKYKYENSKNLIKEIHNYIEYYNETRIVTRLKTSPINFRNKCLNEMWVA